MEQALPAIRKVILIDTDPDDYLVFEDAIHQCDASIEVRHVGSIRDVNEQEPCEVPDLLFLDINMPDRNGFEWLRLIREKGYRIPVIMYSTASNPSYVEKAYSEGANVYFPKPESFHLLKASLEELRQFNWIQPEAVTARFTGDGQYHTFSIAKAG
jgi:DNA-binding NarL/FixJ family response regulator